MKILLYGLGKFTDAIKKMIKKEHEIIGYMDSYCTLDYYHGKPFYKLESIGDVNFDYIVITAAERGTAWVIMQNLIRNYGIDERKMIPFSIYTKSEIVENKILAEKDVCGLILGNSHAYYGYLPEYLDEKFINLSCPSQGIYHNYKALLKYLDCGVNALKKLKYIIFDLYDYNYFNTDISLTRGLFDYMEWGGIKDKNHFDHNAHYNTNFENELFREKYMIVELKQEEEMRMDFVFGTSINPMQTETINRAVNDAWNHIKGNEPLEADKFVSDIVTKRFEETISENVQIIKKMIQKVKSFEPECKIIFTLIPRYITMEKACSFFMKDWKIDFERIMKELQECGVYFLNYKSRIDISGNHHLFRDVCHLNTMGGRCMTSILNEDIKKISKSMSDEKW